MTTSQKASLIEFIATKSEFTARTCAVALCIDRHDCLDYLEELRGKSFIKAVRVDAGTTVYTLNK